MLIIANLLANTENSKIILLAKQTENLSLLMKF